MSKAQTAGLWLLAVVMLGGVGGFIWYFSADVTGYSDQTGLYRYNCDDPRYFADHHCARRACLSAIEAANAAPPNYKVGTTESWGDPDKVLVMGRLRSQTNAASLSGKRFSCTFANGHVVMLMIDDIKVPLRSQCERPGR